MRRTRGGSRTTAAMMRTTEWLCVGVCLIGLITSVYSGPVHDRSRRMVVNGEESVPVISGSNGKARNETSPKKDVCVMEGLTIPRRLVSCPTKPGCRAIQKEGECCPEYQCECERNGKLYENGEKIMDAETPCRVCYCQGGEFTCNNVTCYNRNDCKPRYTPGRCCPEYDNCPPLEITKSEHNENNSSDNTEEEHDRPTTTKRHEEPQKSTTSTENASSSTSTASPPSAAGNDNPLGIKIKEITKPEEIRITDEKPKTVVKLSTSTSTTTTTTSTTTTTPSPSSTSSSFTQETTNEEETSGSSSSPSVTSQTASLDQFNNTDDPFQLGSEFDQELSSNSTDTNKNVREVNEGGFSFNALLGAEDIDESSAMAEEIEPEYEEHNETMFYGSSTTESSSPSFSAFEGTNKEEEEDIKQVIIVDRNGASKPITVIGSSNLQFGGGSPDEDVDSYDFSPIHSFASSSSTTEAAQSVDYQGSGSGSGEWSTGNNETTTQSDLDGNDSTRHEVFVGIVADLMAEEEGSTPRPEDQENQNASSNVTVNYSAEINSSEENKFLNNSETTWENEQQQQEEEGEKKEVTRTQPIVTEVAPLENDELSNPEYPKLPEDFSIHPEEPHFDDQLFVPSSTPAPSSSSSSATSANYVDIEERSPGEPHLVPEWERTNGTEKENLENENEEEEDNNLINDEEVKHLVEESSSSSGELSTQGTLRFDFGGISLHDDMMKENSTEERRGSPSPKDDVESLKMRQEEGLRTETGDEEEEGEEKRVERETFVEGEVSGRFFAKEMSLWDLF